MNETDPLQQLRQQIDLVDEKIHLLLNERASFAQEVAKVKQQKGDAVVYYRPDREAQILRHVKERNKGPLKDEDVGRLFREIMSTCLALEQPLKVAFLGPEGTFTQQAALKHFGQSLQSVPQESIAEVFREVAAEAAHYGVVPVENSTEGVINHTLDLFMSSNLKICGEVEIRIHHHLIGNTKNLTDIKKIFSHQQSFAQCREWLDHHLPDVVRVPVSSNAEAVKMAKNMAGSAAIAGDIAAKVYGVDVLEGNIEDSPDNTTRFMIIGHEDVAPSGIDKTSLLISARNRPGALYRLLKPLNDNAISMSRIESRPSRKGVWEYVFFIDLDGHCQQPEIEKTLHELQQESAVFKILGSYPKAVL